MYAPLVEVWRGDLVESIHHGAFVLLAADGSVELSAGDIDAQMFPRSTSKLMQAAGMVELGLDLPTDLLALAASSHSGGEIHRAGVLRILQQVSLTENALQCQPTWPLGVQERKDWREAGHSASRLTSDCSGKHAAFLATCVINGWDLQTYLDPNHPLQVSLKTAVEKLTGVRALHESLDGCGAPLWSTTLHGLANAYRLGVMGEVGSPVHQVATAMRTHPELVAGPGREPTAAMNALAGVVAKDGAEAVFAMAHTSGKAFALKIADGSKRGLAPIVQAVLTRWGADREQISTFPSLPILGGGQPVGRLAVCPEAGL